MAVSITKYLVESGASAKTTGIIVGLFYPKYVKEHYMLPRKNITEFIQDCSTEISSSDFPILDLGCGRRNHKAQLVGFTLKENNPLYIALDHYKGKDKMYQDTGPNLLGNVAEIPLESSSVGCIVCTEVLEHVPDDSKVLKEISRVIRTGGKLILTVPGKHIPKHDKLPFQVDYRRYSIADLREKLSVAGFSNIEVEDKSLDGLQINIFAKAVKL